MTMAENLTFSEGIDLAAYQQLRAMCGWTELPEEEARAGLEGSAYTVSCLDGEKTVGCARIVWDGGYVAYLSDVIVETDYQGQGIGRDLVERSVAFVRSQLKPGWKIKIVLVAATGKEGFYERLGFRWRPNEASGAGMDMWVQN